MKKIMAIVYVIGVLFLVHSQQYFGEFDYKGNFSKKSEMNDNEWKICRSSKSDTMALRVEWDQKYGHAKVMFCKIIFENK